MNIIIPLCGIGKRFQDVGYTNPKPLIDVFDKKMICHVLDKLDSKEDHVFIIYHSSLEEYEFHIIIQQLYPHIYLIPIYKRTDGAAETILYGIDHILHNKLPHHSKMLLVDCDTLYHINILEQLRDYDTNAVVCFEDNCTKPIYSYVKIENGIITDIMEKEKISHYANTGAYFFQNIDELQMHCKIIITKNIRFKNEYYMSCVIKNMLESSAPFKPLIINKKHYSSLGTPEELKQYIDQQRAFLFDLDGTLVKTDTIYFKAWSEILSKFNISLTEQLFATFIQGNNDAYVMNQLHIDQALYDVKDISTLKDALFYKYINEIVVIDGVVEFMKQLSIHGYPICIVTNCNRTTCIDILKYIKIDQYVNHIIIGNECNRPKPYSDPYLKAMSLLNIPAHQCIIFEDSKPGILSAQGAAPLNLIGVDNGSNKHILDELNIKTQINTYTTINLDTIMNDTTDISAYLTQMILRSVSNKYAIKQVHLDTQKLKGGYISDVIRVQLELESGASMDCVLKYENDYTSSLTKMAYTLGLFDREYYFYESIHDYINICVPKYIGTIKDSNFISKGILLENIGNDNFVLALNLNKEPIDVSLKVIEQCAKFHSLFWNKDLSGSFKHLKKHNDSLFNPVWGTFLRERWPLFSEKWKSIISTKTLDKMEKVIYHYEEIQEYLSRDNLTICHGDVKSGNIFYKKQEDGYMPYFIDWQYIANGKGVQDIVFFMMESFTIDNIKAYRELFKMYYYIKVKEYGVDYSLEAYHKDFEYSMCYFPLFVAVWFGTTPNDELIDVSFPFMFIQKFTTMFETCEISFL